MSRFKKGQSGNPTGRPAGIPSPTAKLRNVISDDLPAIIATLVEKAKDGDISAAALLFSRTLPPLRPQSEPPEVDLPGTTMEQRAEAITAAALAGELSPTGAAELMGILAQQARITEITELAERLERIENALKLEGKRK